MRMRMRMSYLPGCCCYALQSRKIAEKLFKNNRLAA